MKNYRINIYSKVGGSFLFSQFKCEAKNAQSAVKKAEKYIFKQGRLPRYYSFCAIELNSK